jgi:3-hydroxyacyl-CoA dehydrogenase / enoyl-CoA hydratase / 3-hydroxybutyryl-CoA epimerase
MSNIQYQKDAQGIITLTFDAQGAPVNTMNAAFQAEFIQIVEKISVEVTANKDSVTGVIMASAKSTFFAGGDLRSLIAAQPTDAQSFYNGLQATKLAMRKLETLGKPVVAAINGSALGGGLELALGCHYRVCINDDNVQIGFPEVTLGLLPGAGGVVKSVRIMGLQAALPLLTEGTRISPSKALAAGWIHALVNSKEELITSARNWIAANPVAKQIWDDPKYKIPGGSPSSPAIAGLLSVAPAMLTEKTRGNYPAPEAIMAVAVEGAQVDVDTALRIESRYFTQLAVGQVSKNMIGTFFFQMNEVKAGKSRPADIAKSKVKKVGILGAGMMGAGIAWACASKGIACVLKDASIEKAQAGKAYSAKLLAKRVEKNRMTAQAAQSILELIHPTDMVLDLSDCDLVIEAVFENRDLKAKVTKETEAVIASNVVFASNTSTLPITGLAQASVRPEQFIGLHFFSPVDKMQLVEIIKGTKTNAETIAKAYDFVLQIGKTPIVVNDARGFYTSRVFGTYVNEGMALLGEGMPAAMVENAGMQIGMPVGPLAVIDEVSLKLADDVLHQELADLEAKANATHAEHEHKGHDHAAHNHAAHNHDHGHGHDDHKHEHDDHKHDHDHDHKHHEHSDHEPSHQHDHEAHDHDGHNHDHDHAHDHAGDHKHDKKPHKHSIKSERMPESAVYVLEKMSHGYKRMGRAHGAGFYDYSSEGKTLWSGLKTFERGGKVIAMGDAKDRMLYAQALETVRCMDEGVLESTRDANIGSIFGWGFPAYTGGTAQFINHVGVANFVTRADELAGLYGARFTPTQSLRDLAAQGKKLGE